MERPIILKAHEIRGILDGRQCQLRRVIQKQPKSYKNIFTGQESFGWSCKSIAYGNYPKDDLALELVKHCPFGHVGDLLWGRETWARDYDGEVVYRADFDNRTEWGGKWTASSQMPYYHSRILLEIVSVRVERLQDISDDDLGCMGYDTRYINPDGRLGSKYASALTAYKLQYMELYGAEQWESNPWLWVVEFKRVEA